MFQEHIREVLHQVDAKKKLTRHGSLEEKVDLLTLVKKKKNSIFPPEYEVVPATLGDLVQAFAGFSVFEETTLIKDYKQTGRSSGSTSVRGGVDMASAGVSAGALRHRETSSVDIKAKTANLSKMREICLGQKINRVHMPTLRKGEVLGFVSKIVFNTNDVHLHGRTEVDGSCEARWNIMNFSLKGKKKDNSSFTVPAGHIYGYRFNELKFKEEENINILCSMSMRRYEGPALASQRRKLEPSPPSPTRLAETTREPNIFKSDDSIEVTLCHQQRMQERRRKPSPPPPIKLAEITWEPNIFKYDDSTEVTLCHQQQMQERRRKPSSPPPIKLDEVALEPETSESDDSTDDFADNFSDDFGEETSETLQQMQEKKLEPSSPPPIKLDEVALEPETSESDDSTEETLCHLQQMQEEFTNKSYIEYIGGKAEEQRLSPPSPTRLVEKALEPETFEPDNSTEETLETLQQVREKLLWTEAVLQPLGRLPRVTRFALFQSLSVLSEDRDALTLLKKKLDQWCAGEPFEQPRSQSVCSVLHLLSGFATPPSHKGLCMIDSTLVTVDLLVSAMDKLPEHVTSLIAKYRPDTLRGLNQLVSSLMEDGQAHLSESLPAALQDGGQLHWLAVFLCSSDESLREPSELTIVAGDEPGVLLLALCVAVRGLSMLRQ